MSLGGPTQSLAAMVLDEWRTELEHIAHGSLGGRHYGLPIKYVHWHFLIWQCAESFRLPARTRLCHLERAGEASQVARVSHHGGAEHAPDQHRASANSPTLL